MNDTMVQEVHIDAPRERVFRALTDADEIRKWWTTRAKSEPRAGGKFRYDWEFPESPERDHRQEGSYSSLVDNDRVSYPWAVGPASTEVNFTVADEADGTRLRLEHSGWSGEMAEAYQMHNEGWGFFLGNLKSYLEEGKDSRGAMGLKTGG